MNFTTRQITELLQHIEEDNDCKVVGFVYDPDIETFRLDVFKNTLSFQQYNFLGDFHFDSVDFVNKIVSFILFDDELEPMVRMFCSEDSEPPIETYKN